MYVFNETMKRFKKPQIMYFASVNDHISIEPIEQSASYLPETMFCNTSFPNILIPLNLGTMYVNGAP